jgi:2-polyprenyl-3-methyl-5-hydroxy-6-metoxy-1,4-benzoquinol methylase
MVDEGETNYHNLPLFKFFVYYYSRFSKDRMIKEAHLLGIRNEDAPNIAYNWVKRHVELYKSIKEIGYHPEKRKHPMAVNIMNDGSMRIQEGNHTVSIMKHLGYSGKLHVKVNTRSEGWLRLKDKLYNLYGEKLLYQPVDHPDFDDWRVDRECVDRWSIIKKEVDFKDKLVLDVGSNMGYFSFRATEKGATVVGVESNEARVEVSKALALFNGFPSHNPVFIEAKFEDYLENYKNPKFDVVLMLSLLHHYIKRNPGEAWRAVDLLSRCCRNMVLELGLNDLPIKWSPELILDNSNYTEYKTLYEGERPIYLFTV